MFSFYNLLNYFCDKTCNVDQCNHHSNHSEYTGKVYQLGTEKSVFYLVGRESEIHLSPDLYEKTEDSTLVLIREIGQAVNDLLKTGK